MTATTPPAGFDRTGQTGHIMFVPESDEEGAKVHPVGQAMIDVLEALVRLGGIADSRNAIRLEVLGNDNRNRIYRAIASCEAAGMLELGDPLPHRPSYPRVKITERGGAAVIQWVKERG